MMASHAMSLAQPSSLQGARLIPSTRLSFLPTILLLAILLPEDLSIRPGGLLLTLPRVVLLLSSPWWIGKLAGAAATRRMPLVACDGLVLLFGIWMVISVRMSSGFDRALVGASVLALEFAGAYAVIRVCLTDMPTLLAFARFLTYALALNAVVGALDVPLHRHVAHDLAQSITHYDKPWRIDERNGIVRAQGMQEHPILLGVVSSFGVCLALSLLRGWTRRVAVLCCAIGVVSTMSSAPMGATAMGCILLGLRRATPGFTSRWKILLIAGFVLLAALLSVHPRPFSFLLDHFTLDPETGYYRLMIWNLVGDLVLSHWIFGLGLDMNFNDVFGVANTVDSVWLETAVEFGIPGSLLLGCIFILALWRPTHQMAGICADFGCALGIIIFLYIYLGFTVHFWGCAWLMIGVIAALRVNLGVQACNSAFGVAPASSASDNA